MWMLDVWVEKTDKGFISIKMNPFEAGVRKVIPSTLIYIFCEKKVLMIHRVKKNQDFHKGKWNGIGGKLELNEDPLAGAVREIAEETGIKIEEKALLPMGTLTFPSFKATEEQDWICFIFRADLPGKISDYSLIETTEGHLEWHPQEKVLELPLWDGDPTFIPYVIERKPFLGTYWYENKKLIKYKITHFT